MILILGALGDSGIGHLVHRLLDRKLPFLLLDPRDHVKGFEMSWELERGDMVGCLRHGGAVTPLTEVGAVYVHLLPVPDNTEDGNPIRLATTHALLHAYLESTPVPVCNKPSCSASNFSKTYQQQIIAATGFAVPRTLVTNLPDAAADFFEQCQGRVIYKSLSSIRSIVRRMTRSDLGRLDLLAGGPTQFQEWVPGTDFRVHVMGSRGYATEISSDATDYRYSNREGALRTMRGVVLPEEVINRCLKLSSALGLIAAGVDLRRGLDGRWYCFEANPNPAFAFYEQFTGQRIADGLIDALLEAGNVTYQMTH